MSNGAVADEDVAVQPEGTPTPELLAFFDRYAAAWMAQDVDEILTMHTPDTVLYIRGFSDARGADAVRESIRLQFEIWPDLSFEARRLYVTPDLVLFESTATATPQGPLPLMDGPVAIAGHKVSWELCDVFSLEGGLIKRKDCYPDFSTYRVQSR